MRYAHAKWNPAPSNCYGKTRTKKSAICLHHMAGYSSYLRNFNHLKATPPIYISAHFTVGMDGSIEQHVDTDQIAWTQGIDKSLYPFVLWKGFKNRNPNRDCISIEMENGSELWSASYHMPEVQLEAVGKLCGFIGKEVLKKKLVEGDNIIRHFDINPKNKPVDPPTWWWRNQLPEVLTIAQSGNSIRKRLLPSKKKKVVTAKSSTRVNKLEAEIKKINRRLDRHLVK